MFFLLAWNSVERFALEGLATCYVWGGNVLATFERGEHVRKTIAKYDAGTRLWTFLRYDELGGLNVDAPVFEADSFEILSNLRENIPQAAAAIIAESRMREEQLRANPSLAEMVAAQNGRLPHLSVLEAAGAGTEVVSWEPRL